MNRRSANDADPATRLMTRAGGKRTNGKVAAALMEKAKTGDLFAKTPEIHKLEILADKLPNSGRPARAARSFE
jgi:hypothetical protein